LLRPGEARKPDEIYHFLVFDPDMVPTSSDRLMRQHSLEACDTARDWLREQVRPKWKDEEVARARAICDAIDRHWEMYARERAQALERTACTASVWPTPSGSSAALRPGPKLAEQEQVKSILEAASGSFQRLNLLMDAWCVLYFWPIDDHSMRLLPTREAWLAAAALLLGETPQTPQARQMLSIRLGSDVEVLLTESESGRLSTAAIGALVPWLDRATSIAGEQHFHHWELTFPEMLGPHVEGLPAPYGFDLMLGNPPWIKAGWSDGPVLCELESRLGVKEAKSAALNRARPALLQDTEQCRFYADGFRKRQGTSCFLCYRGL
jgi:hypothetical protein